MEVLVFLAPPTRIFCGAWFWSAVGIFNKSTFHLPIKTLNCLRAGSVSFNILSPIIVTSCQVHVWGVKDGTSCGGAGECSGGYPQEPKVTLCRSEPSTSLEMTLLFVS